MVCCDCTLTMTSAPLIRQVLIDVICLIFGNYPLYLDKPALRTTIIPVLLCCVSVMIFLVSHFVIDQVEIENSSLPLSVFKLIILSLDSYTLYFSFTTKKNFQENCNFNQNIFPLFQGIRKLWFGLH
jgi:hypothetical protein